MLLFYFRARKQSQPLLSKLTQFLRKYSKYRKANAFTNKKILYQVCVYQTTCHQIGVYRTTCHQFPHPQWVQHHFLYRRWIHQIILYKDSIIMIGIQVAPYLSGHMKLILTYYTCNNKVMYHQCLSMTLKIRHRFIKTHYQFRLRFIE